MQGLMMDMPLLISSLIEHADRWHGDTAVVSYRCEGDVHRSTWRDVHTRARRLANALVRLGVRPGDRVGTLAWNGHRHVEAYYAISGMGAVCHTINPRLFPEQIAWIAQDAEDAVVLFDVTFLPLVERLAAQIPTVRAWVLMTDVAHMPADRRIANLLCYEALVDAEHDDFAWPRLDETTASSLCYTSGTTGNPKGALYSHRSSVLHAYAASLPDAFALSARDCVMPAVPMFHVNAWGLPYACAMNGAKLVLPGPTLDGASIHTMIEREAVTCSAGVPTVWLGLLDHVRTNGLRFSTFERIVIGGSACPPAVMHAYRDTYGVEIRHAWGMTELSPLGTVAQLKHAHLQQPQDVQQRALEKQGRVLPGVDLRIVDDAGQPLPHDGVAFGDLQARGPWVIGAYFKGRGAEQFHTDPDGRTWFATGDVATIDADGNMQITDRSKDVIKSGGEWISSIDLENLAIAHPGVAEAAVIGVHHPKWDERPLLVVVPKPGVALTREALLALYAGKVAKWWIPDDVVFVDALPHTATGKLSKLQLRAQLKDYRFAASVE